MNLLLVFSISFAIASSASAMIGGMPAAHPAAVQFGMCTGTMIAPNLILTAAHCVMRPTDQGKIEMLAKPGDPILLTTFDGSEKAQGKRTFLTLVKGIAVHPSWDRSLKSQSKPSADVAADAPDVSDIGVIVLAEQIPTAYARITSTAQSYAGKRLSTFGAGCLALGASHTIGTLKVAAVSTRAETPTRVLMGTDDAGTGQPAGLCRGDSGGGVYLGDELVAVNSIMAGALVEGAAPAYASRLDRAEVITWLQRVLAYRVSGAIAVNTQPQ